MDSYDFVTFVGPKLTMEQFLNKLPKNVIKSGKVVSVRDSVMDHMKVLTLLNAISRLSGFLSRENLNSKDLIL